MARRCFSQRGRAPGLCSSFAKGELQAWANAALSRGEPGSCGSIAAAATAAAAFLKLQNDTSKAAI